MTTAELVGLVAFVVIVAGVFLWLRKDKTVYGPSGGDGTGEELPPEDRKK
jgi:uncharacterized membrane protein